MCEDYPCCGHEAGDCKGQRHGSDKAIKAAAQRRWERDADSGYEEDF